MSSAETTLQPLDANSSVVPENALPEVAAAEIAVVSRTLESICELNAEFERRYKDKLVLHSALTRSLVSFQANKHRAVYRWFKYKEGFSAGLVEFLLNKYRISQGVLLDPFAGLAQRCSRRASLGCAPKALNCSPLGSASLRPNNSSIGTSRATTSTH